MLLLVSSLKLDKVKIHSPVDITPRLRACEAVNELTADVSRHLTQLLYHRGDGSLTCRRPPKPSFLQAPAEQALAALAALRGRSESDQAGKAILRSVDERESSAEVRGTANLTC